MSESRVSPRLSICPEIFFLKNTCECDSRESVMMETHFLISYVVVPSSDAVQSFWATLSEAWMSDRSTAGTVCRTVDVLTL